MKNVEDLYPLSPLQASLLQHHQAAPGSGVGFEQSAATLRGSIDVQAFEHAWQRLVARHPILRTCFLIEGLKQPVQLVRQEVDLPVETRDWRGRPEAEQEELLDQLLAADRARGFDVRRAPLMRVVLARLGEDRYQFVWSYQHLLLDGWCRGLVMEDLFELYDAAVEERQAELPPRRPYRDYIAWLKSRDASAAEAFWRERLAGLPGATPLPLDRLRRASGSEQEGWADGFLDPAEVEDLKAFAGRHGLTQATLIQGAWALVLGAAAGLQDVVYGTTVSGRPTGLPGADAMLGMFINNLPVRVSWSDGEDLVPWLGKLQQTLVALRGFEHSAAADLRRAAGIEFQRRLFDSLVLIQNYPVGDVGGQLDARSLTVESFRFRLETAYPLTVVVAPAQGLQLRLHFDGRRYDQASAGVVLEGFRRILLALPAASEQSVDEVLSKAAETFAGENEEPAPMPAAGPFRRRWVAGELVDPRLVARRLRGPASAPAPTVQEAVALWRPGAVDGREALVALAALAVDPGATGEELLQGLQSRLPPTAVPAALALLPELPRRPDGSFDTEALAALADEALPAAASATSGDPAEELMAELWSEVLELPRSSLTGDFFELGGHSLSALQLVPRVRETFGVELQPRALFEQPTLAAMARLAAAGRAGGAVCSTPIERVDRGGELPLSFAQERLWFMHQLEPESAAYNSPRALWLEGEVRPAALAAAVASLVRRHETLRTRFPSDETDRPLQVIDDALAVPLPCLDLTALPPEVREGEAVRQVLARARQPFSLARGPLFRTLLVRLEPRRHGLLFDLHHIASDGWSMNVLVQEMQALYRAALAGNSDPLPPLPVQYADYAAWQKSEAVQQAMAEQPRVGGCFFLYFFLFPEPAALRLLRMFS
ncbi:MAG: condensation domain-containing protein, partial [Acidobacteriota bacterium]|nr:condensation domain-containing protein [Acidobacteriota bacterium]